MRRIMNEDELEFNEETKKEIQISREEFKKGRYYSLEEGKKRLNLLGFHCIFFYKISLIFL